LERPIALERSIGTLYGFTDVDGSQPDSWAYITEVREGGKPGSISDYR
jgi:hypothetical protein